MASLFVTGATGYLGRHLMPLLEAGGFESIRRLSGDLCHAASYKDLPGCATAVHLAAVTGKARRADYFRVNVEGTRRLIEESRKAGVKSLLYISSIAVKFPNQRHYHYAHSKQQAEEVVRASGLDYAIVRPTMIFGPGAPVFEALAKLARAPVVPVFGSGRVRVQPITVDDLAMRLVSLLQREALGGELLEFGGPEVLTMEDLLMAIRGRRGPTVHIPLGLVAPPLAWIEKFMLPPITAGQLCSFANDSVAAS